MGSLPYARVIGNGCDEYRRLDQIAPLGMHLTSLAPVFVASWMQVCRAFLADLGYGNRPCQTIVVRHFLTGAQGFRAQLFPSAYRSIGK
jgi:hypothetical protein